MRCLVFFWADCSRPFSSEKIGSNTRLRSTARSDKQWDSFVASTRLKLPGFLCWRIWDISLHHPGCSSFQSACLSNLSPTKLNPIELCRLVTQPFSILRCLNLLAYVSTRDKKRKGSRRSEDYRVWVFHCLCIHRSWGFERTNLLFYPNLYQNSLKLLNRMANQN